MTSALTRAHHAWLLVLLLWSTGCYPDLNNVRVYADGLVALNDKLEPVAEDFQLSCYRGAELSYLAKRAAKSEDAASLQTSEASYAKDVEQCKQWDGKPEAYAANLAAVTAYGAALQRLSADQTVDYGAELSELVSAADGLTGEISGKSIDEAVGAGFKDASLGLSTLLAKWVTDGYRRGEVRKAVLAGAPRAGVILGGLERFADDIYKQLFLEKEGTRIEFLYRLLERGDDPKARAVANMQHVRLRAEHSARLQRVDALLAHLQAAAQANGALLEKAQQDKLEAKQLFAEVKPLVKEILGVAKAFKAVDWQHAPQTASPPPAEPASTPEAVPEAAPDAATPPG